MPPLSRPPAAPADGGVRPPLVVSPEMGLQMGDGLALQSGRHHFLTAVPSSPCRVSARPGAASTWRSRPQATSAAWPRAASSRSLCLQGIKRALRHPVLPTEISALRTGLMRLANAEDLFFGSHRSLHRPSLPGGALQSPLDEDQWQGKRTAFCLFTGQDRRRRPSCTGRAFSETEPRPTSATARAPRGKR